MKLAQTFIFGCVSLFGCQSAACLRCQPASALRPRLSAQGELIKNIPFLEIYKSFLPIPFSFNEYTATGARLADEGTQCEQSDLNSADAFYHCERGDDSC